MPQSISSVRPFACKQYREPVTWRFAPRKVSFTNCPLDLENSEPNLGRCILIGRYRTSKEES